MPNLRRPLSGNQNQRGAANDSSGDNLPGLWRSISRAGRKVHSQIFHAAESWPPPKMGATKAAAQISQLGCACGGAGAVSRRADRRPSGLSSCSPQRILQGLDAGGGIVECRSASRAICAAIIGLSPKRPECLYQKRMSAPAPASIEFGCPIWRTYAVAGWFTNNDLRSCV